MRMKCFPTTTIAKQSLDLLVALNKKSLKIKDTKVVIRIRISKKNRQHNGQKKVRKDKQRSTKHTHTTKDQVTRTPLKTGGGVNASAPEG